jgi:predicted membrane protein
MQNEDIFQKGKRRDGTWGGIILVLVGLFLLLDRLDLHIPAWILTWQTLLIVLGVLIGIKHRFKEGGWILMIVVGAIFMARDYGDFPFDAGRFVWPVLLMTLGIFLVLRKKDNRCQNKFKIPEGTTSDNFINSVVVFSGENKIVLSKDFKGGRVTSVFGGCDINMMQADFNGVITIEVMAIFGGAEIVVPSNWAIKVDISTVFGGVEDKRPMELTTKNNLEKLLILKGACVFGGVEIKSYA